MKKIMIINGPNLNLLGTREPETYGTTTLNEINETLRKEFPTVEIIDYQSNHEGDLIDRLHRAGAEKCDGIVLNGGGYSHTSIALRDAVSSISVPVVEVHLSNIYSREPFRHQSYLSAVCRGTITGFGADVYRLAVSALLRII